jgi:TnpA family transposase
VATRVFSDEEFERLRSFPDISREELIRFFTLTPADVAFIDPGRGRGPADRLGLAVQLCTLPWLGFVPDDVAAAPPTAVARLAERLRVPADALGRYGERGQTRTEHLRAAARYLGWRPAKALELKELEEFLLARAMEHDAPSLLFRLACEYLISAKVIRPGVVVLLERVAAARAAAQALTYDQVAPLLAATPTLAAELDRLLVVDPELGSTRLHWLGKAPTEPSPSAVKTELAKLRFLRRLDAHTMDLSMLPTERRRFLAAVGRRSSNQALARREPQRRYPILLALLAQSATDVLDEAVQLFDQAISARETRARFKTDQQLVERAKAGEDRQALLDAILPVLLDPAIPDEEVGGLLRAGLGMARLRAAFAQAWARLPRDHGQLSMLDASYAYLRQFTPEVLEAVAFAGGTGAQELLAAVAVLKELNASGARRVPDGTPAGFVPARYQGYLDAARQAGDAAAYRHYWELCVLLGLRDGLRSGDVWVPGSRRYADPESYLFTAEEWRDKRGEFCRLVGKPTAGAAALAQATEELHAALAELEAVLAAAPDPASSAGGGKRDGKSGGTGDDDGARVRLTDQGELVIPPLSAEDVPAEAAALKAELVERLPFAPIASLLVELDHHTGLLGCFTHAGGKQSHSAARSSELKRNLLAVLIASATNLGLVRMAEVCGIAYDVLAWTQEWYVREETLRAANTVLVNYHHRLPLTGVFGGGTMSSSDGQRFPTKGKSLTARALSRYFADEGLSTYTHVSDQHSTYGTKVLVATHREAHYVLDELLGNATDLPITEHATDTGGVTLVNFALFDLVGLQLSPRIRDLGKITLYRTGPPAEFARRYPKAGPLLTQRLNAELITACWDDLLRVAGSLKFGNATASLVVGKWSAAARQHTLAAALKEYGALRRTIHAARYLADPTYRRKIARQLNKGESLHALRRDLHYAHQGAVRGRHLIQQTEQAWCLTLLTNAVVAWTTEYYGLAVEQLRAEGRRVDDALLAHISPAHSENVNFFGVIHVDVDAELAKLDRNGRRPLRPQPQRPLP